MPIDPTGGRFAGQSNRIDPTRVSQSTLDAERESILDSIRRYNIDLEQALVDLSAQLDTGQLTKAEERTLRSATAKMADAFSQLRGRFGKYDLPDRRRSRARQ